MMALITPVAGAYTATYEAPGGSALALGIQDDNGFELSVVPKGQDINLTDQYGMTLLDGIYRGMDCRLRHKTEEWSDGLMAVLTTYGDVIADPSPSFALGVVGINYVTLSGTLVLTSTSGTPAATSPATLTATQALLSANNNFTIGFTSKIREVPIEYMLLPYAATLDDTNYVVWFSTT
jgi:hypothetical protein